jgi:hypothetical protein
MSATERAIRLVEGYLSLTSGLRRSPDFLIIGAQRAGTTSLYRYLAQHPQVVPALGAKGAHYFDTHAERSVAWYRSHFVAEPYRWYLELRSGSRTATGEASPYYLFHPHAPRRAADVVPGAKLIALLREPAARALSHHTHEVTGGFEPLVRFEDAIAAEPARVEPETARMEQDETYASFAHQHYSYLSRGHYAEQLQRWLDHYPREQLLVLSAERFFARPAAEFARVTEFLGLEPASGIEFRAYNAHDYDAMRPRTRAALHDAFAVANDKLFGLLDDDLGWER